jgi:hypothetical protein
MTIRIDQAQPAMPRESLILSGVIPLGTYPRALPNVPVKLLSGVEAQTCRPGRRRIWLHKAPPQPVATDTGKPLGERPGRRGMGQSCIPPHKLLKPQTIPKLITAGDVDETNVTGA